MSDPPDAAPALLRIPQSFHSVDEVLATAKQLNLTNVVLLSETETGGLIFMEAPDSLTVADCNWLLDRMKLFLLDPGKS